MISQPADIGITYERFLNSDGKDKTSYLFSAGASAMQYKVQGYEFNGSGFYVATGSRGYFNKNENYGFYLENYLTYSAVTFDDNDGFAVLTGKYSYISLFNPNAGYKLKIGKYISVNPYAGMNWKWEFKGTEDIDNKEVDNLVFRFGLGLGYNF